MITPTQLFGTGWFIKFGLFKWVVIWRAFIRLNSLPLHTLHMSMAEAADLKGHLQPVRGFAALTSRNSSVTEQLLLKSFQRLPCRKCLQMFGVFLIVICVLVLAVEKLIRTILCNAKSQVNNGDLLRNKQVAEKLNGKRPSNEQTMVRFAWFQVIIVFNDKRQKQKIR